MRSDPGHTDDAGLVADGDDDAVVISLQVEDHAISGEEVGGSIAAFDVLRRDPTGGGDFLNPARQRLPGVGVPEHVGVEKIATEKNHDQGRGRDVPVLGKEAKAKFPKVELGAGRRFDELRGREYNIHVIHLW